LIGGGSDYLDSCLAILSGFLPGFAERGAAGSFRGGGRAQPDESCDKIDGDGHAAIAVSDFPKWPHWACAGQGSNAGVAVRRKQIPATRLKELEAENGDMVAGAGNPRDGFALEVRARTSDHIDGCYLHYID
jgi:hypothetical protein